MEQPFHTDPKTGLTTEQVRARVENGQCNIEVAPPDKSIRQIICSNLFTYFNLIFAVLALCALAVQSYRSLTFLPVAVLNLLIGIIQEIRSKKVLDKLTMLNAPRARVLRDGVEQTVDAQQLVLDDVVIFGAGNQICADGTVLQGQVQVNESLLTGEADEISKRPGDTLLSGSFIVSGSCKAQLTAVGADSYISKLTLQAKASKNMNRSEMIRSLNKLIKIVGILIIPLGIALILQQWLRLGNSFQQSIVAMIAALIGMIPEGLYLLASVALALGAIRLAKSKVLVHEMNCIETLARVNVLCVDKTGTITEPDMRVKAAVPLDGFTGDLKLLIGNFASVMAGDNATINAVKAYFTKTDGQLAHSFTSFSSEYKYSSATFSDGCYLLGAPEFVLRTQYAQYQARIEDYAKTGCRVLLFGRYDGIANGRALTGHVTPLGLVLLENPIRQHAAETFGYFARQGVEIKVLSGDSPLTVSQVASQAGIHGAERYIDASTLQTDAQMRQAAGAYTVFGRVTPEQKRQLIRILQQQGNTVAMTGDGVNDVLALKDADCGIAMASGSDAAAHSAQLVLLDSDFSRMPAVVYEGRRVVNNIQRSASLFLVKNIFSFIMALFSIFLMYTYPLTPAQMSLISGLTIGFPAFLLALEPNKNIIQGRFLFNVIRKALPAGLSDVILVGALVIAGELLHIPAAQITTAATVLLSVVGMLIIYLISRPMNWMRWAIIGVMCAAIVFSLIVLHPLFETVPLSWTCSVVVAILSAAAIPLILLLRRVIDWIYAHLPRRLRDGRRSLIP